MLQLIVINNDLVPVFTIQCPGTLHSHLTLDYLSKLIIKLKNIFKKILDIHILDILDLLFWTY